MRKTVIVISVLIFSLISVKASAQTSTFTKGDNVLGIGLGLGGNLDYGYDYRRDINRIPFIFGSYELCIIDNLFDAKSSIGVGGQFGYCSARYRWSEDYGWKNSILHFGAKGAFHYAPVKNLDTYAGVLIGLNIHRYKYRKGYQGSEIDGDWLGYGIFIGARYYFAPSVAVFAEVGHGISNFNMGIAFKF